MWITGCELHTTNNQAFESTKENTLLSFHSHKSKFSGIKNTINHQQCPRMSKNLGNQMTIWIQKKIQISNLLKEKESITGRSNEIHFPH